VRVALLGALLVAAVMATAAPAKEGAVARLTTQLPLRAAPGTMIRVGWTVTVPDGHGHRRGFGAEGMFVRLLSRTGARPTTADGRASSTAVGRYWARIVVPKGGMGGIRFGLRGWNDHGEADVFFPLQNDPFKAKRK
jgi:hypothetical protein